jgi:hypothetical protein
MTTIPAPAPARRCIGSGSTDGPDRLAALELEVEQMRTAMASRAVIEQAKGILMLLTRCGDKAAFDVLTHISSTTHRKVRDLAVALTDSACGRAPLPADVQQAIRDVCPPVPHAS